MSSAPKAETRLSLIDAWIKHSTNYMREPSEANLASLKRQFNILGHANIEETLSKDSYTGFTFLNILHELLSSFPGQTSIVFGSLELLRSLTNKSSLATEYRASFFPPLLDLLRSRDLQLTTEQIKLLLQVLSNLSEDVSLNGIFHPWLPKFINFMLSELTPETNGHADSPFNDPECKVLSLHILANLAREESQQVIELIGHSPSFKQFIKFCCLSELAKLCGLYIVEIFSNDIFAQFLSPDVLLPLIVTNLAYAVQNENATHLQRFVTLLSRLLEKQIWKEALLRNSDFRTLINGLLSNLLSFSTAVKEPAAEIVSKFAECKFLDQVTVRQVLNQVSEVCDSIWALKLLLSFFKVGYITIEGLKMVQRRLWDQLRRLTENFTLASWEEVKTVWARHLLQVILVLLEREPELAFDLSPDVWHNWCWQVIEVCPDLLGSRAKTIPSTNSVAVLVVLVYAKLSALSVTYTPGYSELIEKEELNQLMAAALLLGDSEDKEKALLWIRSPGLGEATVGRLAKTLCRSDPQDSVKMQPCLMPTSFYAKTYSDAEKLLAEDFGGTHSLTSAPLGRLTKNIWSVSQCYMETQRQQLEHHLAVTRVQMEEALSCLAIYTEKCENLEVKVEDYKAKLKNNVEQAQQAVLEHRQIIEDLKGQLDQCGKVNEGLVAKEEVLRQRIEKLKKSQEALQGEKAELEHSLQVSENRGLALEASITELQAKLESEEAAKLEQEKMYKSLVKEMEKKEATMDDLKANIQTQDEKLKESESEIQRLQKICDFIKDLASKK